MPDQRMTGLFGLSPSTADVRDILSTIPVRKGGVLPLTEYGDGTSRLDWTAGIPGSLWEAFTAPARAYRGEIAPENMLPEGLNFAGSVALGSAAVPRPRASVGMGGKPTEAASHLDMSPEARMARAREMGFDTDTTYYRGTSTNEVEARPNTWIADDPAYSSSFASGDGGNIMPLYARGRFMSPGYSKEDAMAAGFDGRRFGDGTVQVFDPTNIRSVNAAFDPAKSSSANLLAANPETGAAPGLGLMAAAKQEPKGFIAYHGSPHDFDRFDISRIGTGEGVQAYGHGLYAADSPAVADSYRGAGNRGEWNYDPSIKRTLAEQEALSWLGSPAAQGTTNIRDLPQLARFGREPDLPWIKALDDLIARGEISRPGRLYQVRINADPDHFLDWDKPLSQQSEAVRKALGQTSPPQRLHHAGSADANALRDLALSKSFLEKGYGGLDAPARRVVLQRMLSVVDDPKVRDSVVGLVPVDVMNVLARKELPSDVRLHDATVLFDKLVGVAGNDVSLGVDAATATIVRIARAAAERLGGDLNVVGVPPKLRAALGADEINHSRPVGEVLPRDNNTSEWLSSQGIKGIKYLDQGSRAAGNGSRNYVVFDDKLIDILKKYGLFGSLGMGAASMMSGGEANAAPAPKASPLWALQPGVF